MISVIHTISPAATCQWRARRPLSLHPFPKMGRDRIEVQIQPIAGEQRCVASNSARLSSPDQRINSSITSLHNSWEFVGYLLKPRCASHGNMAEIELSALARQCLSRRIGTHEELDREVQAWQQRRDEEATTITWRFTTADARIKLKRLYPSLEPRKRSPTKTVAKKS